MSACAESRMVSGILYLSRDGDSLDFSDPYRGSGEKPPIQLRAEACKTHEEVLALLKELSEKEDLGELQFMHIHNTDYKEHLGTWPKGTAHPCPLSRQLEFVAQKILEQTPGAGSSLMRAADACCIM